jgi:serine/threonine protein kinase
LLKCFGWSKNDEYYFIIYEKMDCDLEQYILSDKPDSRTKYEIAKRIAKGIEYIHSRKYLHRDIKPANILIKRVHQDFPDVKIADLGLLRGKNSHGLTHTVVLVGTPAFMSPEVLGGKYDFKTDVYAYGILLSQLITARTPFGDLGLNFLELAGKIKEGVRPTVDFDKEDSYLVFLAEIARGCWENDLEKRYSIEKVLEAFSKCTLTQEIVSQSTAQIGITTSMKNPQVITPVFPESLIPLPIPQPSPQISIITSQNSYESTVLKLKEKVTLQPQIGIITSWNDHQDTPKFTSHIPQPVQHHYFTELS